MTKMATTSRTWRLGLIGGNITASRSPVLHTVCALSVGENSVHGSDAPETAAEEIAFFFSGLELVG